MRLKTALKIIISIICPLLLLSIHTTADEPASIPENQEINNVGKISRARVGMIKVTGSFAFTDSQKKTNELEGRKTRSINEWLRKFLENYKKTRQSETF